MNPQKIFIQRTLLLILTRLFRVPYVLVLLAFLFSPMSYASEEAESTSSEINKQLSDGGGSKEDLVKRTHLLPESIGCL